MSADGIKSDTMIANFRKSGRRGTIHWDYAPLEGEAGGFSVVTASATDVTVFVVPSMKAFHLKTLIVTTTKGQTATLNLFASDGGGKQRLRVQLPSLGQLTPPPTEIQGLIFGASYSTAALYAQVVSASAEVAIFAGGQVRDQDAT